MLEMVFPLVPPSVNHAYESHITWVTVKGKKKPRATRRLTTEGSAFKKAVSHHIVSHYAFHMGIFQPNKPLAVSFHFMFPRAELLNAAYPKTSKSRYKGLDASNRVKLMEDALVEATNCDDAQNWAIALAKSVAPDNQHQTVVRVWDMEEEPDNPLSLMFNV